MQNVRKFTRVGFFIENIYLKCVNYVHLKVATKQHKYRGSPTYTKITNTVSTTKVFGLCTCKWGILALVGDQLQSHYHEFHLTRFFPNPKMRVRRGPSICCFVGCVTLHR